jgi:hypothetical protein
MSSRRGTLFHHIKKRIETNEKRNLAEKFMGDYLEESIKLFDLLENKYDLRKSQLLGLGTSSIVFNYKNKTVLKVCSKNIKYFHGCRRRLASDFQNVANRLEPYLLPIREILFDGPSHFVYIQEKCQPLDKYAVLSMKDFSDLLLIIQHLFKNGLLVGQLKSKNVGYDNHKRLVLFDYHSMHDLFRRAETRPDMWYISLQDSLTRHCYQIYASREIQNFSRFERKERKDRIKKIMATKGTSILPDSLDEFFSYIKKTPYNQLNTGKMCKLLEETKIYYNQSKDK